MLLSRSFVIALASIALAVGCGSGEPAVPPAVVPPPTQPEVVEAEPRFDRAAPMEASGTPTRAELFLLLSENADVPLSAGEFCNDVIGVELGRAPRLGDWVAYNLSVLEEDPIALPARCEDDGERWRCTVEFSAGADGESPWTWGVGFSMRKSDRQPLPESLMCRGAG